VNKMPNEKQIRQYRNPVPTTDIFIEYDTGAKKGIVLIKRKNPPKGYALPGGFAEYGITLEDNARKEAKEETNLEVELENPGKPFVFSSPDRDPRGHMISNLYFAKGRGELRAGDDAKAADVYTVNEIVSMLGKSLFAFDHEKIIVECLRHRKYMP